MYIDDTRHAARSFWLLRLALHHAWALVVLRRDTGDGLRVLRLWWARVSLALAVVNDGRVGGRLRTLRYSLVASWYSLFMVDGEPLAPIRMVAKMAKETATPMSV